MLRAALVACLCTVSTAALAANFPIRAGVAYCADDIKITQSGLTSEGMTCSAARATEPGVPFQMKCQQGEAFVVDEEPIALTENINTNTLVFIDEHGTETLTRCE
jgi:hypothetical protein